MSPVGGKAGPVLTDNGNFVLDGFFPAERMKPENLKTLYEEIKLLNGVVEVGLFVGMGKAAYFGNAVSTLGLRLSLF
jgi:ribose 5-phosphate isomerase A